MWCKRSLLVLLTFLVIAKTTNAQSCNATDSTITYETVTSLGFPEQGPWATATSIRNGQPQPGLYAPGSYPKPNCDGAPTMQPTVGLIASDLAVPTP